MDGMSQPASPREPWLVITVTFSSSRSFSTAWWWSASQRRQVHWTSNDSLQNRVLADKGAVSPTMFGCIVAGRLVQTNLQQVDTSKYVFELQDGQSINHVVLFLLGTIPFEVGYAATVHFLWPGKPWQLLGMLSNEKPSAIFRLRDHSRSVQAGLSGGEEEENAMQDDNGSSVAAASVPITVGISIEPIAVVEQQMAAQRSTALVPANKSNPVTQASSVVPRLLENLYNYVMSFAGPSSDVRGTSASVPIKVFQDWYENVQRRLRLDPNTFS